jgi:uncharacterized membrane protein YvbJ
MRKAILGVRGLTMKTCNNCGTLLKDDQIFCNKCGTKWVDLEAIRQREIELANLKAQETEKNRIAAFEKEQERLNMVAEEKFKKDEAKRQKELKKEMRKNNSQLNSNLNEVSNDNVPPKKFGKIIIIVIRWVLTLVFGISTIALISSNLISAICFVVVTYFACPLNIKMDKKVRIPPGIKFVIATISFLIGTLTL